jgi:phosphoribosyl 1,2-cyclic phosphodiesterase
MEVLLLASGSSGNACLIRSGGTSLLVDAGISARTFGQRLAACGGDASEISAVVLSHEHIDHVRGLANLVKRRPLPVWATAGTWAGVAVRPPAGGELASGRALAVGTLTVLPVATSHDAREPVAFVVDDGVHRLALCTDTGIFTALLAERLQGCHLLLLEANHDADLLRHGPYPWSLKQRIAGRLGHLANHQAEEAVEQLTWSGLAAVVGLHLSAENNDPALARASLAARVGDGRPTDAVPRAEMRRITLEGGRVAIESVPVPPARRTSTMHG